MVCFGDLSVMTRNIYVGTDVDKVLEAEDLNQIPFIVAELVLMLESTDFLTRAGLLADEIALSQPHLIALQEVSLIRFQSPGDYLVGNPIPAEENPISYLNILLNQLGLKGLNYTVAGVVQNADVELPMFTGFTGDPDNPITYDDVRLTDYDVVLARADVQVSNVTARNFKARLTIPEAGIVVPRGYVLLNARVDGKRYHFINTHLEPASLPIRLLQAFELVSGLWGKPYPIVMAGDFNSQAPNGLTYKYIASRGFVDVWTRNSLTDNPDGFTYGHDMDLRNRNDAFDERIDFIFVRNKLLWRYIGPVAAIVVGEDPAVWDMYGLWPSDHGGVVASLSIPRLFTFAGF